MKKIILIIVTGVSCTSLSTGYATAQTKADISFTAEKIDKKIISAEGDKKGTNHAFDPIDKTVVKEMEANLKTAKATVKVTNHLNKSYKDASNIKWNTEAKAIVATFNLNDKSARVVYDKKGNWLFTIITYQEEQMPKDIKALVTQSYGEFNITLVQEISQGDITVYKVYLEDCSTMKHLLVFDNEITVFEEFTKGK